MNKTVIGIIFTTLSAPALSVQAINQARGEYAQFIPQNTPISTLDSTTRLARLRAYDRAEQLKITLTENEAGDVIALTQGIPVEGRSWTGSVYATNEAPRYSSSGIAGIALNGRSNGFGYSTWANRAIMKREGGGYDSGGIRIRRVVPSAIVSLGMNSTNYANGGIFSIFGQNGRISNINIDVTRPVDQFAYSVRIKQTNHNERLDGLQWADNVKYTTLGGEFEFTEGGINGKASIIAGVSGERTFTKGRTLGLYDGEGFNKAAIDMSYRRFPFSARLELQHGSRDMPSAELFSLGGSGRGAAFPKGVKSGPAGIAVVGRIDGESSVTDMVKVTPYIQIDGGVIKDINEQKNALHSISLGLTIAVGGRIKASSLLSKGWLGDGEESRLSVNASYSF